MGGRAKSKRYSASSIVRLYLLKRAARERAVADRAGGGGPSPYRHALNAVRSHIYGGVSQTALHEKLAAIRNEDLARSSVSLKNQIFSHLNEVRGAYVTPPAGHFESPSGEFEIVTKPDVSIETDNQIIHFIFWNNKTADMYQHPAEICAYLFIRGTPPDLFKRHVFRIINIRANTTYEIKVLSDNIKRDAENFLNALDNLVLKARLRRLNRSPDAGVEVVLPALESEPMATPPR